jgi:hypothetical protein
LRALVARAPDDPLARYVFALHLVARSRYREALDAVGDLAALLGDPRLERDRQRLAAVASFCAGDYARARALSDALARDPAASERERREASDERERAELAAGELR